MRVCLAYSKLVSHLCSCTFPTVPSFDIKIIGWDWNAVQGGDIRNRHLLHIGLGFLGNLRDCSEISRARNETKIHQQAIA